MLGKAKLSPTGRGVDGTAERIARLEAFERWRPPTRIDFASIIGAEAWEQYWSLCEQAIEGMRQAQLVADGIREKIVEGTRRK
jgi:hypothetical protein